MRDQRLVNFMIYYRFGGILIIGFVKMIKYMKNMVEKSRKHLKKLIKRYQIYQPHTKRILMLYIPVEHLHLVICQNLLIRLLLLHILKKMKIIKVLHNKILIKNFLIFDNY